MAYNDVISRSDAAALVKPEFQAAIVKAAAQNSMALSLFKPYPIMTNQSRFPVLATLPTASWINPADTGIIETSEFTWNNVYMDVADLGVIVPMPKSVVSDVAASGINMTAEMVPYLAEAAGIAIDKAIFFGTNAPSEWSHFDDLKTATAAVTDTISPNSNNTYNQGSNSASKGGIAEDLNQCFKILAAQGVRPNAIAARSTFEYDLAGARATDGQLLLDLAGNSYRGRPIAYGGDGVFPTETTGVVNAFVLDSTKFLIGVRQDMEISISDQAVIMNGSNVIQYNLFQQNMVAVKLVMRVGVAVANPVTRAQATEAKRYPAVTLLAA